VIHIEFIERLSAISSHEKKSLSVTSSSELFVERAYFSCEYEGGGAFELAYSFVDL
jgi:hypothetical protein